MQNGRATVDAVVSLTGFSLVGGPAYNDARAAEELLAGLDVPYVTAHPVEFQTLEQWEDDPRGLLPIEATMMVAIPELDGGIWPMTFGGRSSAEGGDRRRDMVPHPERTSMLAARVARVVSLRRKARAERKIALVVFNFPPNGGTVGSAAYLSVFASLLHTLRGMAEAGYTVDVPENVDALRDRLLGGNASLFGANANVAARLPVNEHVRRQRWLDADRGAVGASSRAAPDRRCLVVHPGRTLWQCLRRRPAGIRIRRRSHAPAVRAGFRADACLLCVLPLDQPGFWRRRGAAFRNPWRVGIHAGQAGGNVRGMLARPADRRSAKFLPLRLEQSIRGNDREAARRALH